MHLYSTCKHILNLNIEIEKGKKVKEILKDIQGKKFWERLNTVVTPERDADWIYRLILGIYGRSGGKELTERDYKVFFKKSYLNDVVPLRGRPGYYQYIYSRRKVFVDNPIPGERNHFNDTYGIRPWGMPTWFRRGYLEESRTLISTLKTSCRYRIKKEAAEVARKYLNIEESLDEIVEYFSQETKEKPLSLNSFVKTQ